MLTNEVDKGSLSKKETKNLLQLFCNVLMASVKMKKKKLIKLSC